MAEKKYYWLKLKKDFFKRHDIKIIEAMPNGKDYVLFYLKLLVESIDHDGNLRFSDTIPYSETMLSTITDTNVDVVRSAMKIFTELGMVEILDDRTIFMIESEKMLGCETSVAERVRRSREKKKLLQCNVDVTPCNEVKQICNTEKEIEKEIEIDEDTTPKPPKGIDARFKKFWSAYPRKVGKGAAEKSFKKYKPDDSLLASMLSAIAAQKKSEQWKKDGGQFIPNPSTWLNQKRWEDEIPQPKPSKQNKSAETGSNSSLDMGRIGEMLHKGVV